VLVVVLVAVFAIREPFDEMHQKRLFVLHTENVSNFRVVGEWAMC
jgi:hypothetical protein